MYGNIRVNVPEEMFGGVVVRRKVSIGLIFHKGNVRGKVPGVCVQIPTQDYNSLHPHPAVDLSYPG